MPSKTMIVTDTELEDLLNISIEAGKAIMEVYRTPFEVIEKNDGSPLTIADKNSNDIINEYLKVNFPYPILSEENDDIPFEERKNWDCFWMIDPLDGTKEFVNRRREFTVNISLIKNNKPVLGIIYAPVFKDLFYAIEGHGSFMRYKAEMIKLSSKSKIRFVNQNFEIKNRDHLKVILSRSHNDGFDIHQYINSGSYSLQTIAMGSSLKFCRIAQGKVDMNIRMKPTSEWDTAAAQIILEEAGRNLVKYSDGSPLDYNKEDILNPYFVAY